MARISAWTRVAEMSTTTATRIERIRRFMASLLVEWELQYFPYFENDKATLWREWCQPGEQQFSTKSNDSFRDCPQTHQVRRYRLKRPIRVASPRVCF